MAVTETVSDPRFPLYAEANQPTHGQHDLGHGVAVVFSNRSPNKETANEDSAAIVNLPCGSAVLLVADGLGGLPSGEQASRQTVETIADHLLEVNDHDLALRTGILNGIEAANQRLLDSDGSAATTLAAVSIDDHHVRPYHVGDSMILIVGQRGKVKLQTISHSPVGYAIEAGVLDAADAMYHEERHLVSNVVGCSGMRIEMGADVKLAPHDTLLVASDGLFDNLHLPEIIELIRKGPLPKAMQAITECAHRRMLEAQPETPSKPDDLTCILYRRSAN